MMLAVGIEDPGVERCDGDLSRLRRTGSPLPE